MQKLVIFDLDGTLLDSLQDIVSCCNMALKEEGVAPHTYAEYLTYIGDGSRKLVERALPQEKRDVQTIFRVMESYHLHYHEHYDLETKPFDGILEMLERLIDGDILLAVLTNKADGFGKVMVEEFFPATFDVVLGQREGIAQKPSPTGVEEILGKLKVEPQNCVLVGDSDIDIFTAQNAGVCPVGVTWGYRSAQELEQAGAKALASSPKELGDLLFSLLGVEGQ